MGVKELTMLHRMPVCVAVYVSLMLGCTNHVDVLTGGSTSGGGGSGAASAQGGSGGAGAQGGSGGVDSQGGSGGATDQGGSGSTGKVPVGCLADPAGTYWVNLQVGGTTLELKTGCGYPYGSGPAAFESSGKKSKPQWQFYVLACLSNKYIGDGPGIEIEVDTPPDAAVSLPYTAVAPVLYYAPDGSESSASNIMATYEELGAVGELVKGSLTGTIETPADPKTPITAQFLLCRGPDGVEL